MFRSVCALILLAGPLIACADGDDAVRKEFEAMKGKWKTVGGEMAGQPFGKDALPPFSIDIGADGKSTGHFATEDFDFTLKIDPKSKPKTTEIVHETGTEKGKTQFGIYKLEGDKYTVCVTAAGSAVSKRPKEFTSANSSNVVFVFERVKEVKKP